MSRTWGRAFRWTPLWENDSPPGTAPTTESEMPPSPVSAPNVTHEVADMASIVRTNLTLMQQQYEQVAKLQHAQWEQAEAVLKKVEAILGLLEDFLAGIDEQTDRLVTVSAALIRYQQELASQQLQRAQGNQATQS